MHQFNSDLLSIWVKSRHARQQSEENAGQLGAGMFLFLVGFLPRLLTGSSGR
jgi:hypothetical protein